MATMKTRIAAGLATRRAAAAGAVLGAAVLITPGVLAPSAASASPATYLESTCSVKALSPTGGLKGDGCSSWGVPHTVTIGGDNTGTLPASVLKVIFECASSGAQEFVKAWASGDTAEIPPNYAKAGSVAYFAVGCIEGAALEMIDLSNQ